MRAPRLRLTRRRLLVGLGPVALVMVPVVYGLVVLWPETIPADNLNDTAVHFALVRWARQQIELGHVPLDGWYPYLGMGSAEFHHYQTLGHVVTAYLAVALGAATASFWTQYLLLALWPISVFAGARLFDLGPWAAAVAAVLAPLVVSAPNFGFEHQAYVWQGYGLWTQLWAMCLLPPALGLAWRALDGRISLALGALAIGLTLAFHFFVGYFAGLMLVPLVASRPRDLLRRAPRGLLLGVGALAVAAWEIVPLLTDQRWLMQSEYNAGTFYADSFGVQKAVGWLLAGQLYDDGRVPVITVMVGVGILVALWRSRREAAPRAILGIWALSLVLFFGKGGLDALTNLLPFGGGIFHRYIVGIHLGGLLLAGMGVAWLADRLLRLAGILAPGVPRPAVAVMLTLAGLAALVPAAGQVAAYDSRDGEYKAFQVSVQATDGADFDALVQRAGALGGGRIYAGTRANWGAQYRVGYVAASEMLLARDADALGFTLRVASMLQDAEARFDETNPSQYDVFNVRFLILPADHPPPVSGAVLVQRQGRHTLWQVPTTGYIEVVDTTAPPIPADGYTIARRTDAFMRSAALDGRQFPTIAYDGRVAGPATLAPGQVATGSAGFVAAQQADLADGVFGAQVTASRPAAVLLKASFDPRFTAFLDGVEVKPYMVAPGMPAINVPAGRHGLEFRYVPYPSYPQLLGLGLLAVLGLGFGPRLLRRMRPRRDGRSAS